MFPIKYHDLPSTTQMVLTLWDVYSPRNAIPVGGTTFYLFGKNRYFAIFIDFILFYFYLFVCFICLEY